MRHSRSLAAGVASLALVCAAPARAAGVGTAGAANTRSIGAAPGGPVKVIEIGEQVVANERIATSNSGSVQIVFIDKTTLNIGPNSELVIDRFVFNPATATGEMALTLSRGALRIVGGQATHTGGATISTPVATIGVRGGIAQISHCPSGGKCGPQGTQATNVFGRMSIASGGATEQITRPDFTTNVAGRDAPPSAPVRASGTLLAQNLNTTTSKPGQSGGARSVPSDTTALAAGTGDANRNLSAAQTVPVQAQTTAAPLALAGAVPQPAQSAGVSGATSQGQQAAAINQTIAAQPKKATGAPPQAYVLTTTAGAGSNIPFLTASFATAGGASVTPVYGYRTGGLNADGTPNLASRAFQASLAISGTGASQTSLLNVMTALLYKTDNAGMIFQGHFRGSARAATSTFPAFVVGDVLSSTQSGAAVTAVTVPTDATGLPTGAFPVTQNYNSNTNNGVTGASGSAVEGVKPRFYTFDQTIAPATAPAQLGVNHPVATLTGYAGGIARTTNFSGFSTANPGGTSSSSGPAFIVTNATNSPGDISISLQSGSRVAADFSLRNLSPAGTPGEFVSAKLGFGGLPATSTTSYSGTRGAYVDLTHFAAIERRTGSSAQFADSSINGVQSFAGGTMVNANVFNNGQIMAGFTPCACDFTQWGLWSMDSGRGSTATSDLEDRTGIAFWVAGTPSTFAAMPTTGTATYFGHAIASVATGPAAAPTAQYIAGSPFGASVNFATRNALIAIPSLDNTTYSGAVSFGPGATTFGGTLASTVPGRNMAINGTLFQAGAASPAGEIGGGLTIQGGNYLASGIFLGKKL